MFNDKSILITGGTGSFGKQYTQTILERYKPKRVIIFSRDELKQFEMQQEFNQSCMRYFIGDVRDRERLSQALQEQDLDARMTRTCQLHSCGFSGAPVNSVPAGNAPKASW